jgi:three-Cys-motif partner protein
MSGFVDSMVDNQPFFREQRFAGAFKHGIYQDYLPVFVQKTGRSFPGDRVVVCDAYAGPGRYTDGTKGSPLIAAELAYSIDKISIELFCIEKDPDHAANLEKALASDYGLIRSTVRHGPFENHIEELVDYAGRAPLFAFIDPFGMGADLTKLQDLLNRDTTVGRGRRRPTEILLNFSYPALMRNAPKLSVASTNPSIRKGFRTTVSKLDKWLGDDSWQEIWRDNPHGTQNDRQKVLNLIVSGYIERLAGSRIFMRTPVEKRWGGPAIYELALFTNHDAGLWWFNESVSKMRKKLYQLEHGPRHGELELDLFAAWGNYWQRHIALNVERILAANGFLKILGKGILDLYGETLGWARGTHANEALKKLHDDGKIRMKPSSPLLGGLVQSPRR